MCTKYWLTACSSLPRKKSGFVLSADDSSSQRDKIFTFFSDKVVGVHCTHGVNRTGYVVCRLVKRTS